MPRQKNKLLYILLLSTCSVLLSSTRAHAQQMNRISGAIFQGFSSDRKEFVWSAQFHRCQQQCTSQKQRDDQSPTRELHG